LYALRDCALPPQIECDGREYRLERTFKHDFFAATGLYRGDDGLAVLKVGRTNSAFALPLSWIGRLLCGHEVHLYEQAQDLPGVPRLVGRVGPTGFLHDFVPGRPLERRDTVGPAFFDELQALLRELHTRHIAYVDLNKRQNILLGEDGKPYLIDFQIALHLPPAGWRRLWPVQWFLRRFQNADIYHCLKHKRRLRPDQLTEDELARVSRISIWIRLHRWVARPLTHVRRWILRRLRSSDGATVDGSSAK
jgi:hypothetical protein